MNVSFWEGKKVFLTGHTGFKGSWLSTWLLELGAEVIGLSLPPNTQPALFEQLELDKHLTHHLGDIRDANLVSRLIQESQPDIVFHLAAQPLVRLSYVEPVETWNANVMGTIHVLEALRKINHPCVGIFITTDKCYENREWVYGYRENDHLGGRDPYSSSKAGAELAIASWRNSFFSDSKCPVKIASVRAGNVIGGGDWAKDRIVPDAIRSLQKKEKIPVRNPQATRPWQHVLEPLSGYLLLAEEIYQALTKHNLERLTQLCTAFNFGPLLSSNRTVEDLVLEILCHWPGNWQDQSDPNAPHEAGLLNLVTDKAYHQLGWQPRWNFETTIKRTVNWYYQTFEDPSTTPANVLADIVAYSQALIQ
ncbi:MAG: CDP-glucose 4,6-dehydratase [Snowella sp.]|nr:CDP-glucose 4,6-dehydratase [Snowella sp.]